MSRCPVTDPLLAFSRLVLIDFNKQIIKAFILQAVYTLEHKSAINIERPRVLIISRSRESEAWQACSTYTSRFLEMLKSMNEHQKFSTHFQMKYDIHNIIL